MTDRALQLCIGISLALHLLVLAHGLMAGRADAVAIPSEPEPVRIRLRGPETKRIEVEAPTPPAPPEPTPRPPAPVARPEPARRAPTPHVQAQPTPAPESAPAQARAPEPESTPEPTPTPAEPVTEDIARLAPSSEAVPDSTAAETLGSVAPPAVAAAPNALASTTGRNDEDEDLLSRYAGTVRARIEGRKHYPAFARKRSVEGSVAARVAIGRDGRLESVEFESGAQPLLRKATEAAIRSAAPYPAPPHGPLTIELSLDYSLRDAS